MYSCSPHANSKYIKKSTFHGKVIVFVSIGQNKSKKNNLLVNFKFIHTRS